MDWTEPRMHGPASVVLSESTSAELSIQRAEPARTVRSEIVFYRVDASHTDTYKMLLYATSSTVMIEARVAEAHQPAADDAAALPAATRAAPGAIETHRARSRRRATGLRFVAWASFFALERGGGGRAALKSSDEPTSPTPIHPRHVRGHDSIV